MTTINVAFILTGCSKIEDCEDEQTPEIFKAPFVSTEINIDGSLDADEWSNGSSTEIWFLSTDENSNSKGILLLQHDPEWLYVGVQTYINADWDVYLSMWLDGNDDQKLSGNSNEPHVDIGIQQQAPGAWLGHGRYDYLTSDSQYPVTPPSGTARAGYGTSDVSYEFKISLSELSASPGNTIGFFLYIRNNGVDSRSLNFPSNQTRRDPSKWFKIELGASNE